MSWIDTAHCSTAVSENFCEVLHSLFCCRFGSEIRVWILTEDHRDSSGEKERVKARGAGGDCRRLFDAAEEFHRQDFGTTNISSLRCRTLQKEIHVCVGLRARLHKSCLAKI